MKKLLFLPIFALASTYPDFSMCYNVYKKYTIIPISKHYSVTATKPKKFVKYDEDLGLYLIKTKKQNYLHFKKTHIGVWLASITKDSIYSGNYAEYEKSLKIPAKFSSKTTPASVLTDIFCNPIGIGVKNGFLSKTYITKFITAKPPKRKDLLKSFGILFDNKDLMITKILPNSIASRHYLSRGKIVKINNMKVTSIKDFAKIVKSVTIMQDGLEFTIKADK